MSDRFPMPGAWDSMWETPVLTTQGLEVPIPVPPPGVGHGLAPIQAMQSGIAPFPVAQMDPLPAPVAATQGHSDPIQWGCVDSSPIARVRDNPLSSPPFRPSVSPRPATPVSPRTWGKDYNQLGCPQRPVAQDPKDVSASVKPFPSKYALFADTSDTERNGVNAIDTKPPIVIAVFGQTGTGKTSFIKAVTGEDLQIGHTLTSCETYYLGLVLRHLKADEV